ncbi:MAG TPA: hypothetical protein VHO25_11770 [Polyangiaceae bacterium]|nr:hypothetical protein [Polyangiaceae bacterium]
MSSATRMMLGLTLIVVPTIIYGGLTVLGVVSGGRFGAPAPQTLTPAQQGCYRAGHAHAGVLMILSLILQMLVDDAQLGSLEWSVRIAAPAAAILVSGGFFGIAHLPALRGMLYLGALLLAYATVAVGIGLL